MADSSDIEVSCPQSPSGRVNLVERLANPQEIGKAMREVADGLVLRLHRNHEPIGFWEGERAIIQDGDLLLMVVPTIQTEDAGEPTSATGRARHTGQPPGLTGIAGPPNSSGE